MGPKLNLEFLTQDECEKIIEVIQKDLVLQHVEQQRIWKINEEVRDINEFCKILGKQNSFNENYCLYCFLKFRLFFRRKYTCKLCEFNFCSNCVVLDDQQGGNVCSFCVKKWQCQKQSLEWFYLRARSKFKRSGSSKVIKCLSLKNSLTAACKSQSMDGDCGLQQRTPDDELSDLEIKKNIPEGSSERYLNELTEKLMNVQSSCMEENIKMRTQVAELIEIENSLSEMDHILKSLDNNLLMDHHQEDSHHHHHNQQRSLSNSEDCCLRHCSNETLLNLAANQISDITAVAAGVLEKSLSRGAEVVREAINHIDDDDDDDDEDIGCKDNNGNEDRDGYGDDTGEGDDDDDSFDGDSIELDDEGSDSSTEKVDQSEDSICSVDASSDQSTVWLRRDETEELKSAEQEIYKAAGKTYMLGERLADLEDEIIVCNKEVFDRKASLYEEEVAELAVEVSTNQREVECLQRMQPYNNAKA